MRWRILVLLCYARIGLGFQFQTVASVDSDLVATFGFTYTEIGLLIGLFMFPGLVLALPVGFAGRYLSDRFLSVFGLGALAVGGALSGLAPEGWIIGLGRILSGAGFLVSSLYFTKMVADWFEGREIATAMSILVMSWPFGIAMGQIGHVWLAHEYGWRAPFLVAAAYCAVAALCVGVFYRPARDLPVAVSGIAASLSGREWILISCAGMAWGAFNAAYVIYLTFAPETLEQLGQPALRAATIISIGSWLMILSGALCGQIADRFGRRDTILVVCMSAAIASLMLLRVPDTGVMASLLFGILGMAPAGVIIALAGQAVPPERRALGMGVFFTIYHAFNAIIPPISGAIFDRTSNPHDPLVFGMILFAFVVPFALIFRRVKSRPLSSP
ncbi:MAG: MFS family permease [Paracoccaceae bacterium]|jgi:MFS family permease